MAYFSRLIIALLLVFPSVSFADSYYWPNGDKWFPDAISSCKQNYPGATNFAYPEFYNDGANARCFWYGMTGGVQNTYGEQSGPDVARGTCPGSKIPDLENRVCIDPPPEPDPCPEAGTKEGDSSNAYTTNSKVPANNLCIGSCSWSAGGVVPSVCANGKCYYYGPFTSNGTACSGDGGGPSPPEPEPAPPDDASCVSKGQCPGTINGTKVCVPCSSKEGTTSESGSSSGSGTDSSGNPTGDTGTTNTTKETTANCTNGSCNTTTTTTVTNPDGSTTTTTETEAKPQADFCKANPGHIVCKGEDEGTWGGVCGNFQCTGDAVQCAQAKEAAALRCALTVDPGSPLVATAEAAVTGASGVTTFGVTVPGFDSTNPYSGTCPVDVHVSVSGMSFTIPLSQTCPYIQFVGWCLVAAASLAGARVAFT